LTGRRTVTAVAACDAGDRPSRLAIPYLRDYAKAPFILGLMLLMARLAIGPMKPRRVLAHAGAFGALLGLGFGFRNDLLICAPPFTAVVLFCVPGHSWAHLRLKMAALTLAALTFTIAAWPILTAYRGGSNTGHVALLGLMTNFDRPLGINGSLYDWGYTYRDGFAAVTINSYSVRAHGRFVRYLSPEYDRAMVEYILQIARVWPADIVTRAYASALQVLGLPFQRMAWLTYAGPLLATVVVLAVSSANVRLALFAALSCVFRWTSCDQFCRGTILFSACKQPAIPPSSFTSGISFTWSSSAGGRSDSCCNIWGAPRSRWPRGGAPDNRS
jgi:hypothetical protein